MRGGWFIVSDGRHVCFAPDFGHQATAPKGRKVPIGEIGPLTR